MKWVIRFFNFYLDASFHVALAAFSFIQITAILLHIPYNRHLNLTLFFGTLACYNFIKYGVEAEKYLLVSGSYQKWIQAVSILSLGLALYHFYFLPRTVWIGFGLLSLLTAFYTLPVLPQSKNLRSLGGFKIFIVAGAWAIATVVIPILVVNRSIFWDETIELTQRFILVVVLMLPFEIRDLKYDPPALRTLPQVIGIKRTKLVGVLGAFFFLFLTFLKDHPSNAEITSKGIIFMLLLALLWGTKREQHSYFASLWVDAVPLVWWFCLLVLTDLF